jgi:superfamily II DNA or RNA helicase
LWLATNAGKTEVIAALTKVLREHKALVIVHKKTLLHQTVNRVATRLDIVPETIGIIGDGRFDPKHITVATVQSIMRKGKNYERAKKFLKSVGVLFVDEGHHTKAATWYNLTKLCRAQYRYLLSGTPFGSTAQLLVEAACGPVIMRVSNDDLIKWGHSARPTITMVEIDEPKIDNEFDTWGEVYKQGIVLNTFRNDIITTKAAEFAEQGKPVLILVKQLWHGDNLLAMTRAKGVEARFVHGQMPSYLVESDKSAFEAGQYPVIIASPVFEEGVDVPAVKALIIADGGKSFRSALQKIGRALRKKLGENVVEVVDFADLTHKWLSNHSLERMAIYEEEGFEVTEEALDE